MPDIFVVLGCSIHPCGSYHISYLLQSEPSTTNDDYVYVDLSGITSAALAADKEPDLIDIDELVTQCLNIEKKKSNAVNLDAEGE